MTGGMILTREN